MKVSDLRFQYPKELIATHPAPTSRVMWVERDESQELTWRAFLQKFLPGDLLVVNETRVIPRKMFGIYNGVEQDVLFVRECEPGIWEVLCQVGRVKGELAFPEGIQGELVEWGFPQKLRLSKPMTMDYFDRFGEMPIPPYISSARSSPHSRPEDHEWYQTIWAQEAGSVAAPTSGLHFKDQDLDFLRDRGVEIVKVTLHVGAGTFFPVQTEYLSDHKMHKEWACVPLLAWKRVQEAKNQGHPVWVLGTTAVRALESCALGLLKSNDEAFEGETSLLIQEGFDFKVTDRLLTNFHQPETTLLALVGAFAGLDNVLKAYAWAVERKFRLFSYGDLTAWITKSSKL